MSAYNVVRFRVKPGREEELLQVHRGVKRSELPGLRHAALVKTGERSFCFIGEWSSFEELAQSRERMLAILDRFRDTLEDLGGDLGVTDPVSGEAVVELSD